VSMSGTECTVFSYSQLQLGRMHVILGDGLNNFQVLIRVVPNSRFYYLAK